MGEIAGLDLLDRQDDQDVGGAELVVDDGAVADIGAEPEIALDQRRQRFQRGPRVDRVGRQHVHVDAQMLMRPDAPVLRRKRVVVEEAQGDGVRARVGALEAGAADHHIDAVLAHVRPHALPEQLERALVAVGLEHAGAAKLHEAVVAALRLDQRQDVVFALRIKTVIEVSHLLAQHAISADHARPPPAAAVIGVAMIDHEQMVEYGIEVILVAARQHGERVGHRRHLFVEHFVAEALRLPDLTLLAREPDFERADAAIDLRRMPSAEAPGP